MAKLCNNESIITIITFKMAVSIIMPLSPLLPLLPILRIWDRATCRCVLCPHWLSGSPKPAPGASSGVRQHFWAHSIDSECYHAAQRSAHVLWYCKKLQPLPTLYISWAKNVLGRVPPWLMLCFVGGNRTPTLPNRFGGRQGGSGQQYLAVLSLYHSFIRQFIWACDW